MSGAFTLAVHPGVAVNTFGEFVGLAKREPGKLVIATTQLAASPHHIVPSFNVRPTSGGTILPFRSGQDGLTALMRRDAQAFLDAPTIISPQVEQGALESSCSDRA